MNNGQLAVVSLLARFVRGRVNRTTEIFYAFDLQHIHSFTNE